MNQRKCPVIELTEIIGGKWIIPIIWEIGKAGTIRYNKLKREVTDITNTELTRKLENLIGYNLVIRKDFQTTPPKVEYSLTQEGQELHMLLQQQVKWIKGIELES